MKYDRYRQNGITLFIIILATVLLGTAIYSVHRAISARYTIEKRITYRCNARLYCRSSEIDGLHEALTNYLSKESTIQDIVEEIPSVSKKEIESSVQLKKQYSDPHITLIIKHKNEDKALSIYSVVSKMVDDYQYQDFHSRKLNYAYYKDVPNYKDYFIYSAMTGFIIGIIVISCGVSIVKIKERNKPFNNNY